MFKNLSSSISAGFAAGRREFALRRAAGVGIVSAVAIAVSTGAAHAQVTFSATAANEALSTAVNGGQDLFWDNYGNVFLIVMSIGIIVSLGYLVYRAIRRRK